MLVFFPIIFEYTERLIGHVTDPALNPFVDALILAYITFFTIINVRGLLKLYKRQLVSNMIPWIAIILSGLSVASMVFNGR
jgi:amino acid transporter